MLTNPRARVGIVEDLAVKHIHAVCIDLTIGARAIDKINLILYNKRISNFANHLVYGADIIHTVGRMMPSVVRFS